MKSRSETSGMRLGGFTLVELLVAMVVTSLVILLISRVLFGAAQVWRHSSQRVETWREARAAIHCMERDLATTAPVEAGGARLPPMLFARHPATPEGDFRNEELYFLTMLPQGGRGSLCAVGYRAVWDEEARCYRLMRRFMPGAAVERLLQTGAGTSAAALYFGEGSVEEELARYVWDLEIRPCKDGVPQATFPGGEVEPSAAVEIRFKAIGAQAVEQLREATVNQETWSNPDDPVYRRVILPRQQQFIMRARLYAAGK